MVRRRLAGPFLCDQSWNLLLRAGEMRDEGNIFGRGGDDSRK